MGRPPKYVRMPQAGRVVLDPMRLRYWRLARALTRKELADAAHLSWHSIESYEEGRKAPHEKSFRRLCTALGIDPQDVLFEDYRYTRKKKEK